MKDEKWSRDTAKSLVVAIINGAKYTSPTPRHWNWPTIEHMFSLSEYKDTLDYVKSEYSENIASKSISRMLQVEENELL